MDHSQAFKNLRDLDMLRAARRITVIGNAAGGKTTFSRRLSALLGIPVYHIDSVQFLPGMVIRPLDQTRAWVRDILKQDAWILDGLGPFDLLLERFQQSDLIVFMDLPVWLHYWWFLKRQLTVAFRPRQELPEGCREFTWSHTRKVIRTMWGIHRKMNPELRRILARPEFQQKSVRIVSVTELEIGSD